MPSRRLRPLEIALIVIDAILVVVLIVLLVTAPDGPDDAGDGGTTSATAAATEPGATDTGEPSSTQAVTVPEGAVELAEFVAPSGNIWCTIGEDAASCQIKTIEYQPPAIDGCADNDLVGHVLTVDADGAEFPCPDGPIPGADPGDREELDYDKTSHVGDYMCTMTETGVSCTNILTGSGFTVRRAEATLS